MIDTPMNLVVYIASKFIAYTLWSAFGIGLLRSPESVIDGSATTASRIGPLKKWLLAIVYGVLRLLMGVIFGLLIWQLSTMVALAIHAAPGRDFITYLLVYVPVRWVEWTIMAVLILPGHVYFSEWIVGAGRTDRLWRLGGIAISCLADIPLIAMADWSLPIGRFFC